RAGAVARSVVEVDQSERSRSAGLAERQRRLLTETRTARAGEQRMLDVDRDRRDVARPADQAGLRCCLYVDGDALQPEDLGEERRRIVVDLDRDRVIRRDRAREA